jgi:hypothetical protein
MSMPTVVIEYDTALPTATPTWQDVTVYVRVWASKRGRQYERDRVQAGTISLTLDNSDRRFDPTYAAGPYFGSLDVMHRVRVSAVWDGVTYYQFTGYITDWSLAYPRGGKDAIARISASDGLTVLAQARISASYSAERTDERLDAILSAASWTTGGSWVLGSATNGQLGITTVLGPVGDRALDEGVSLMQAQTLADVSALDHLYDIQAVENGIIYVDGAGVVRMRSRHGYLYNRASQATFSDDGTGLPYRDLALTYDVDRVYNDVIVTRVGGSAQTAEDATQQTKHFTRTLAVSDLPLDHVDGATAAEAEALAQAQWLLARYKSPQMRVESLTLLPFGDDALWPYSLGLEIGDVVTVQRTPAGALGHFDVGDYLDSGLYLDAYISQLVSVQAIAHRARPGHWETVLSLAPQDTTTYWQLNDSVASVLGTSTTLAY